MVLGTGIHDKFPLPGAYPIQGFRARSGDNTSSDEPTDEVETFDDEIETPIIPEAELVDGM